MSAANLSLTTLCDNKPPVTEHIVRYYYFDSETMLLVNERGSVSKVPESINLDLRKHSDAEKHLKGIGFIGERDCLVMQEG